MIETAPLREGDRLTRDEFLRRWEAMPELKRAELINGTVHMPSPVSQIHCDFHFILTTWLGYYVAATPGVMAGTAGTWLMPNDNAPQPDLALRILEHSGGQSRMEGAYLAGAPELIVEISHTTASKDSGEKLRLYERNGVREYVSVRPQRREIAWRTAARRKYSQLDPGKDGWYRSLVFPGLWLDPAALWDLNLPGIAATVQLGMAAPDHARFVRRLQAPPRKLK